MVFIEVPDGRARSGSLELDRGALTQCAHSLLQCAVEPRKPAEPGLCVRGVPSGVASLDKRGYKGWNDAPHQ